jgi:hypothetical protein
VSHRRRGSPREVPREPQREEGEDCDGADRALQPFELRLAVIGGDDRMRNGTTEKPSGVISSPPIVSARVRYLP